MTNHLYQYEALVTKIIDGDTFVAMISLGFDIHIEKTVRLYGINTPEIKTAQEGALDAANRVKELIEGKKVLLMAVQHQDKYGRFLARCLIDNVIGTNEISRDLADILIEEGLGKEYYGGAKD